MSRAKKEMTLVTVINTSQKTWRVQDSQGRQVWIKKSQIEGSGITGANPSIFQVPTIQFELAAANQL